MADFDIPVEDFEALQALVDAGDLSAAETRFRELTDVSAKDARFFVREMAEGTAETEQDDEEDETKIVGADFDIPVEDFEALQALVDAGDLSGAETRFRELTDVSAKDARFFVREMAEGMAEAKLVAEEDETRDSEEGPPEPKPVYTNIPLSGSSAPPLGDDSPAPSAVASASVAVKPPPPADDALVNSHLASTAANPEHREQEKADASDSDDLRWYERMLPFFTIPLLRGGLVGGLFCGLGWYCVDKVLQSSRMSRAVRYLCALLTLLGVYVACVATIIVVTGSFSLFDSKNKVTKPAPIEPSSTVDWNSPASSVVAGTDSELQKIHDLYYRPADAFPLVSTSIKDSTLTVVSIDVKIDSALTGVPLLEKDRDLIADLGRGNTVTLVSYALRLPSDGPGSSLEYIDPVNSAPAKVSFRKMPVSKHRKRPVLRCIVRLKRVPKDDLTFHLFDERTGRKVSSAKPVRAGEVDFQLGIWHRTPLLMVVEAKAWATSATARHSLPLGEDVALGLGRAQVAYLGRGHLDGVKNGATIEVGKPYRLVRTGKEENSGMVIVRYAPPYLADPTSLLITATKDHLASSIPAFGDFELKPVGPERDLLGFRVFHVPPTIDNQLQGKGLRQAKSRASQVDVPKVERPVDFASDVVSASFESQRGRGLIAMDEVPGMQMALANENLFGLEIPLLVFEEGDPLQLLLQFAADAVEFDLEEIDSELKLPGFLESIEYTNLTPRQALLDFEQLSGVRVVVDSDRRRIRLQP